MKYFLNIFPIWVLVNGAVVFDEGKELTSYLADKGCHVFADSVTVNPINPPVIDDVGFQLRTPCKRIDVSVKDAGKLRDIPEFDVNKKTVIFIAGWLAGLNWHYIEKLENAYHCRGDYNFIVANTGGFIRNLYINSAYHTDKLGEFLAEGLRNTGLPSQDIHLVGHSLGAHIAGSIGRHYEQMAGVKIARITGLDPARPCFKSPAVFPRLSSDDADFVDVMHTNPYDLGMEEAVGDADFYVEGLDVYKPGCWKLSVCCSHELAVQYYLESVYTEHEQSFMGSQCEVYPKISSSECTGAKSPMGFATSSDTKGIYYVPVNEKSPYGTNAQGDASFMDAECTLCQEQT